MLIAEWLKQCICRLEDVGVGTARLDCLVLLEDLLGKDRSNILAHSDNSLNKAQLKKLDSWISRRSKHEPLAFIRGKTEFYGCEFIINNQVLEPRPESETMIELLKNVKKITSIADIGTGSGALAVTAKLEIPECRVYATDVDKKCLAVARKNAKKFDVNVKFYEGNLLGPIKAKIDVVLANMPYVPDNYTINQAAMNEPKIAIFGGEDGLDVYRNLFEQISSLKSKPKYVFTESLPLQHKKLSEIAKNSGYKQLKEEDFIQQFVSL